MSAIKISYRKEQRSNPSKRRAGMVLSVGLLCAAMQAPVHANEAVSDLIKTLKEKGVLSNEEYSQIKDTLRDVKQSEAEAKRGELKPVFKDGISIESASKDFSISLTGRVHADYRNFLGNDGMVADTFEMRRARVGAKAKFYDRYEVQVIGEFGQGTAALDIAHLDALWWPKLGLRFGQFKMPMGLEQLTSSNFIDFQERSFADQLVPGKEIGAMAFGEITKGVNYGLALSNGRGINRAELSNIDGSTGNNTGQNNAKADKMDVIGRVTANFAEILKQKDAVYHAGLAFSKGEQAPGDGVLSARSQARGATFFQTATFDGENFDRTRYGVEAAMAKGPVKFQAEHLTANYQGNSKAGVNFDRDISAWYASINWLITGEKYADNYKAGAFGRIRPNTNFQPGSLAEGWGAWEVGVRFTEYDASDFAAANAAGTGRLASSSATNAYTNKAGAWTAGVKWIVNPNTRFMLNYVQTGFDTPVTVNGVTSKSEKAATLRAQFDF